MPAETPSPDHLRELHADNRAAWNQAAEHYARDHATRVARLRAGTSSLHALERANLAPLGPMADWCRRAVHLQCASGEDALSLLLEGAGEVIGIDLADAHVENARRTLAELADDPGAPFAGRAAFHRGDVLDVVERHPDLAGTADLVYTGRGAICWLHDLAGWGRTVASLLRPDGVLHLLDDHPAGCLFDFDAGELRPSGIDYFDCLESSRGWPQTYVGDLGRAESEHALKHERLWTLADVFAALTGAGLVVTHLGEHPEAYWGTFPNLPEAVRRTIPLSFTIMARRPDRPLRTRTIPRGGRPWIS